MRPVRHAPVLFLFLVAASIGCGDAKQKALRGTLVGLNTARDGFVAWDDTHQQEIVENAKSFEEGKDQLKDYRQKRERVLLAFEIAYKTLAAAALEPRAENVGAALQAAEGLYNLVKQVMSSDKPTDASTSAAPALEPTPATPAAPAPTPAPPPTAPTPNP